jgi:hypothetical protein
MSGLQNSPRLLEQAYRGIYKVLRPFRRWLVPGGWTERLFIHLERVSKGAIFDCRMCGQCILHSTGMTCPMTCPKSLRNGPCGGVRLNGNCEVQPEMPCVWVLAWERSKRMPAYGGEILTVQTPVNHQLQDTSAWINDLNQKERMFPRGW